MVGGGDGGTDSEGTDRTVSTSTGGRETGGGLGRVRAGLGFLLRMGVARTGLSRAGSRPLMGA